MVNAAARAPLREFLCAGNLTQEGYLFGCFWKPRKSAVPGAISLLLAVRKLYVLPRVPERRGLGPEGLLSAAPKVAYELVSLEDVSNHTIEVLGEALDPSDKAAARALRSAYSEHHAEQHRVWGNSNPAALQLESAGPGFNDVSISTAWYEVTRDVAANHASGRMTACEFQDRGWVWNSGN